MTLLHVGGGVSVRKDSIVGIFDIDSMNTPETTKDFMRRAEKEKRTHTAGNGLPKSFILVSDNTGSIKTPKKKERSHGAEERNSRGRIIFSQISARSLEKRCRETEYFQDTIKNAPGAKKER